MSVPAVPASAEWKAYWPLVLACAFGFSMSTVASHSIGLFMDPISGEMGWTRTQISAGLSLAALSTIILSPIGGAMIDRWGSRSLAIPGIALTAIALAGFGLAESVSQWIGIWLFYAVVSVGVKLTVWTAAVSKAFTAGRGFAIAATISGTALTGVLAPPITNWLIDAFGWRHAFLALAIGWGSVALLLSIFFLHEPSDPIGARKAAPAVPGEAPAPLTGLTIPEALRSGPLWRIGLSTLFILVFSGSLVVHQVPILIDAGVARGSAALLASVAAIAGFGGKLVTGWLMDRAHAARISGLTLALGALGFALLLEPLRSPVTIVIAMVIIGYAGGAKLQVTAYLTGRYGGLRNFGKIFGVMSSIIAVGGGVGPVVAGAVFDTQGSYTAFLIAGIPGCLISGFLIFGLGAYPVWDEKEAV